MSTFGVTVERIAEVWEHTNADRLAMARVQSMSYQFVIAKGSFQQGDLVLYFPIDCLLPQSLTEKLGLAGKLAGPEKNRVKTVRLRGEISQGVVTEPALLLADWTTNPDYHEGQDLTEMLGVTKYEPPPIFSQEGTLRPLPPHVSVYDIEGVERFGSIAESLMDEPVLITEKLEGSHFAISIYDGGEIVISQRRYSIEPVENTEHDWHKTARLAGLREKLPMLKTEIERLRGETVEVITLRGEMIGSGIQGNYYRLPGRMIKFFEIEVNGEALSAHDFLALTEQFEIDIAPVLSVNQTLREWLDGRTIADISNGNSALDATLAREGIVIRPMNEMRDISFGRYILKQRSPHYLATSDY